MTHGHLSLRLPHIGNKTPVRLHIIETNSGQSNTCNTPNIEQNSNLLKIIDHCVIFRM